MKCKTKDCKLEARITHYEDELKNKEENIYLRTAFYKCPKYHITEIATLKTIEPYKKPQTKDYSIKRFHRKGFKNHNPKGFKEKNEVS